MVKVDIDKFWIEGVLTAPDAFPHFLEDKGADLDGNGVIEGDEKFGDLNQDDRFGDRGDWMEYLRRNRSALSAKIPFFKWGQGLSVTNRIHQLLYLESDLSSDTQLQSAYTFITRLVQNTDKEIGNRKALAAYDRALAIDPKYVQAHNNRGVVLYKLGRPDEALAAYMIAPLQSIQRMPMHTITAVSFCISLAGRMKPLQHMIAPLQSIQRMPMHTITAVSF